MKSGIAIPDPESPPSLSSLVSAAELPRRSSSSISSSKKRTILTVCTTVLAYHALSLLGPHLSRFATPSAARVDQAALKAGFRQSPASFDWLSVPSSEHLTFQPCGQGLECARLKLPLDYWNGTNPSRSIGLAVVRLPARVPVTDQLYGGSILVNPGGPGGSGVKLVSIAGSQLQAIVDSGGNATDPGNSRPGKYFDIVSFDPRGVGFTTPGAHCWESEAARESWILRASSQGIIDSSDSAPGRLWSMAQALGSSCASTLEGEHDIKQFLSTASVARDMLELVEALGEWREKQAATELLRQTGRSHAGRLADAVPGHLLHKPGKEKLLYWGFSYGSYLGSSFASMYPDRIERMILDGVVDAPDYYKTLWTDNLRDTERVVEVLYDRCAAAGVGCPLMEEGFTSEEVKQRVHSIIQSLYHRPLPIPGPVPEVVTYSDLKLFFFICLYAPVSTIQGLFGLLKAVEDRDGSRFEPFLAPQHSYSCTSPNGTEKAPVDGEAQLSIICSDGDPQDFLNATLFNEHWRHLDQMSPTAGAIWSQIRLQCSGWRIRALHRFRGPFGGNTSHPILWIGNTADPVTPLWAANQMAARFPGSVVLTQDSPGHCSLAAFSLCTWAAVSRYFDSGELPRPGTVCPSLPPPFGPPLSPSEKAMMMMEELGAEGRSAEEIAAMAQAHETAGKAFFEMTVDGWGLGFGAFGKKGMKKVLGLVE